MSIHDSSLIHRIDRRLNHQKYQQSLEEQLYDSICKFQLDASQVIFQQFNASIHTTRKMNEWFFRESFNLLSWPS